MSAPHRVVLKPRHARPFFARHPWVFVNSIQKLDLGGGGSEPGVGDEVDLFSHEGKWVARGMYNPKSAIRVRLYRWDEGPIDEALFRGRIEAAVRLRRDVLRLEGPGRAYRLVNSEGDGLSGLVVDRFDRWLVVQMNSAALATRLPTLVRLLNEATGATGVLLRTEKGIARQEGLALEPGDLDGEVLDDAIEIIEHEIRYQIDLRHGQKTGFYLDQRENRAAAARYCGGKRVLDVFCHAGGFALNALKHGGAAEVLGIDSSRPSIESAVRHAGLNGLAPARFEVADAFDALAGLKARGERFDVVICDPPKFARGPQSVEDALKAYLRLNRLAVEVLTPDGILVTCSCSGLVDRELFVEVLAQVAEQANRRLQFLEQRTQAADHPVAASCLESDYLKCMICRVE